MHLTNNPTGEVGIVKATNQYKLHIWQLISFLETIKFCEQTRRQDKWKSHLQIRYVKCLKILYTNVSDEMAYANSAHPDHPTPEGAVW